jgi:hypothetical protein
MPDYVSLIGSTQDGVTTTITPAQSEAWLLNDFWVESVGLDQAGWNGLAGLGQSQINRLWPNSSMGDFASQTVLHRPMITDAVPLQITIPASDNTFQVDWAYTGIKL